MSDNIFDHVINQLMSVAILAGVGYAAYIYVIPRIFGDAKNGDSVTDNDSYRPEWGKGVYDGSDAPLDPNKHPTCEKPLINNKLLEPFGFQFDANGNLDIMSTKNRNLCAESYFHCLPQCDELYHRVGYTDKNAGNCYGSLDKSHFAYYEKSYYEWQTFPGMRDCRYPGEPGYGDITPNSGDPYNRPLGYYAGRHKCPSTSPYYCITKDKCVTPGIEGCGDIKEPDCGYGNYFCKPTKTCKPPLDMDCPETL